MLKVVEESFVPLPEAAPVAIPEGWQLVPKRADDAMMLAAWKLWEAPGDRQHNVWNAMLAASPAAPASEPIARDVLTERLKTAINQTLNVLEEAKADADWGLTEAIICISFELKAILEAAREGKS